MLPGRLVYRLRCQGWPNNIAAWVASFATNRLVRIRLDNILGPPIHIACGLPQGSPVSPILFMLYIAPLFNMGIVKRRFGYADDTALLHISPSLSENTIALATAMEEALEWGKAEGITFEASKSELKHFTRRQQDRNHSPPISTSSSTISENPKALRWLGVLFDRKLTFKDHVKTQASKAMKVSKALSSLGNTCRGVPPYLLRKAAVACVLPIAYYGAETWWPGRTRPGTHKPISCRMETSLQTLSKVTLTAARAVLPVYKTTPTAILYRESGLPPPEIALNSKALAATTRLKRLDQRHPLLQRARTVLNKQAPTSRFARRVLKLASAEQVDPIILPPWGQLNREEAQARIGAPCGASKENCSKSFLQFIKSIPANDIVIYSDGSKLENDQAGAGVVAYQGGHQILKLAIPLGTNQEVYDAEARAALAGLEAILKSSTTRFATNLWVCLDNLEVATQLLYQSESSSQGVFQRFANLAPSWFDRERLPHIQKGGVFIRWVPGHMNIPGNDAADKAAKEGAATLPTPTQDPHYSLASLKRMAKTYTQISCSKLWLTVAPQSYRELGIMSAPTPPKELTMLSRATLGRVIASRSGHGDFADYHSRFNHSDAHLLCSCGARKAPFHFFFCRIGKRSIRRAINAPPNTIDSLLGTHEGLKKLDSWLCKTKFYNAICPRNLI